MKSYILFFVLLMSISFIDAQNIDIPDANFKTILTSFPCWDSDNDGELDTDVDTNNDGEISIMEAEAAQNLYLGITGSPTITNLTGIEFFTNITSLEMRTDNLGTIDLSQNINLVDLSINSGNLTSLDVSALVNLEELSLNSNMISSIDVSLLLNLEELNLTNENLLSSLDITNNAQLHTLRVSSNLLGSLDLSNNNLSNISIQNTTINSLDISNCTNLSTALLNNNLLNQLDVSQNSVLSTLVLTNNPITALDVTNNPLLTSLGLEGTTISLLDLSQNITLNSLILKDNSAIQNLDISNNLNLSELSIEGTAITELDFSNIPLEFFTASNSSIEQIFMKNGLAMSQNQFFVDNCPNLEYICADDEDLETIELAILNSGSPNVTINSYCSFVPGGAFFTIQGDSRFDSNSNGCDVSDPFNPFMKFMITSSSDGGTVISSESGSYNIPVQEGAHEITPQFENPLYYSVSPSSIIVDFPSDVSPFIQDFCITSNGIFNDLEIVIIPISQARPGFDSDYKLICRNQGTTALSGNINLMFADELMDFVSSNPTEDSQAPNQLSWSFNNLQPFEIEEIDFVMNLNTPTDSNFPLEQDDVLEFTATVNSGETDETPVNNSFSLNQTVVNSLDPNDKTCLEGGIIREAMVGEYVHYMIRFENSGTASAINVVVKDAIDMSKFDINTLVPIDASHNFITRILNTNEVEFIFENINLPFDDANNDGFVTFKIKTLETLVVGDSFSNDANIYFDFNAPIITNDYITAVEDNLSIDDLELSNIKLYPNPVNDKLYFSSEVYVDKASIYDINGRLLKTIVFYGNENLRVIDLQKLTTGLYVVQFSSENGKLTHKIIKD